MEGQSMCATIYGSEILSQINLMFSNVSLVFELNIQLFIACIRDTNYSINRLLT